MEWCRPGIVLMTAALSCAVWQRHLQIGPSPRPLWLVLGFMSPDVAVSRCGAAADSPLVEILPVRVPAAAEGAPAHPPQPWAMRIAPHTGTIGVCAAYAREGTAPPGVARTTPAAPPALEPSAKIVSGYESGGAGMPSYQGVLTDAQIEALILFIRSIR